MLHDDDPTFLIPCREEYLGTLHRMLDATVLAEPGPHQLRALEWLQRSHEHLHHVGRVARMHSRATAGLELVWVLTPVDGTDPEWQRVLNAVELPVLIRLLPVGAPPEGEPF